MTVYFARVKGYVKIGYSSDPAVRMLTICTGSSLKPDDVAYGDWVDLLGTIPGGRKRERELHAQFAEHRVVGEWFRDVPAIEQVISDDPDGIPDGVRPAPTAYGREITEGLRRINHARRAAERASLVEHFENGRVA